MTRPLKAAVPYMSNRGDFCFRPGDSVTLKGILRANAEKFSINFTTTDCDCPENIIYHFKLDFDENTIIENSKENNQWSEDEVVNDNESFENDGSGEFKLQFTFQEDKINTFIMHESTPSYLTSFSYNGDLTYEKIKYIQVWDDVDKISEILFQFN
ncbi:hypothetical protein ACFFRR_011879 [Megaselia abdita]